MSLDLIARVHRPKCHLFFASGRCEAQLKDVSIIALDSDHRPLSHGFSHSLYVDHALIGKDAGQLNWHPFARTGFTQVDHHRNPRRDGDPFIAAVEVAVSEPAPTPVRFTLHRAFRCVLYILPISDPNSRGANVARDDRWQIGTASHGSVNTHFNAP